MKSKLILIMQVMVSAAFAAGPPLQDFCQPFKGDNCEVIWTATTNFPATVKRYSVEPTKFSPTIVSSLLQIAGLKSTQRRRVDQLGVFAGKDVKFFGDKNETSQLNLVPSQGFIVINKTGVIAQIPKEMPVGVPQENEALRLTLDLLEKIGISQSEVATNADGKIILSVLEGNVIHKDKSSGLVVTNITDREIDLCRQIEGISVWGGAGISAKFGNEGKLAYLSVTWRAVKHDKDCPVPTPTDFINRIKAGQVLIRNEQANATFKKLTITKASLYYWENSGSQSQSHIYPFAVLEAHTDLQGGSSVVELFVPLTDEL